MRDPEKTLEDARDIATNMKCKEDYIDDECYPEDEE